MELEEGGKIKRMTESTISNFFTSVLKVVEKWG
jgi:hypothetical protein